MILNTSPIKPSCF